MRAAGALGCVAICLWGFYAILWPNRPLDEYAAIYSVATIAMACFIFWNLAKMAQHMADGLFAPNFGPAPAPVDESVGPEA
jgi:hypothetical protein